jgi:hypothetical protein
LLTARRNTHFYRYSDDRPFATIDARAAFDEGQSVMTSSQASLERPSGLAGGLVVGCLTDPADAEAAARALAAGACVAHGFANFYALTTRADAATVQRTNLMKGRPATQVGSVITTASRIPLLFDWDAVPSGLTRRRILAAVDALFNLGPCGFRGPAARWVPDHLTTTAAGGARAVQLIAPGYGCPSRGFVARALAAVDDDILHITSANRSHHRTGAADEPAHYRAAPLAEEFAAEPGFRILAHLDDEAAQAAYPAFAPMSVTVLSWMSAARGPSGRPALTVVRHGSLPFDVAAGAVERLGCDVTLSPTARQRLRPRSYPD